MITKGLGANNERLNVVHRFHKRESCVFHSIHRLSGSFERAGRNLFTSGNRRSNRRSPH
jgi:hypothetical protein